MKSQVIKSEKFLKTVPYAVCDRMLKAPFIVPLVPAVVPSSLLCMNP